MDDFDRIKQQVLQQLHRCVVCHREYEEGDITSIQRRPGVWTLMVECDQCHSRNYIAAVTDGVSTEDAMLEIRQLTREVMNDVSQRFLESHRPRRQRNANDEIEQRSSSDPVTAEDVLDMHEFLEAFDGDFSALFRSGDD